MAKGPGGAVDDPREDAREHDRGDAAMLPLLTSVLAHADQGIAVYDAAYVLRCCNARYGALLDLPAAWLRPGETKLIDVLRLLAARGDYGDEDREALAVVRFATMRSGAEPRYERRMPSGTWVQFNRNSLPGGGLVVTLTDVTAIKQAEQRMLATRDEATRTRRQLTAAIESMSEGFVLWDSQDRLVMFNTRYRDEYSFAPELLVPGVSFESLLRAGVARGAVPVGYDPEEWVQDRLRQHLNPPAPYVVERHDKRSVLITEYRTHEGGIVGIRTDVTLIKESERAARDARQRLVDAIEAIPQGFAIFDSDDRIVLFNQAYKERYSLVPDMVRPGVKYEDLPREVARRGLLKIPPEQHEAWIAERVALHRSGKRKLLDQRKGRWIAIEESRTSSGHIVVIHTDVTELKRREQEARRSRRMLRGVIDAVPAIISVKDRNSRYVLMNRFQGEVYGIEPAAAIGKTSAEVVGADYGGHSQELDERVISSGAALPWAERDFVDGQGKTYTWLTTKVPLKDENERVENVLTVALDISALKATERARANLARYVSPTLVDLLAEADEPFGPARSQDIGVLFADMVGFTQFAAEASPDLVFALLRDFQRRLARIVFAWGGTLDKFTGDGIMATFGTPAPTGRDAANALQCARAIAIETATLDRERRARGEPSLRASVGVHWGPALMGNIGDEKRLEFAVVGDTVNVASRLESLTRSLAADVIASEAVILRAAAEGTALADFAARGAQMLRGRETPVGVWTFSA
jgi:PAS domain S-box-containing protein